MIRPWSGCLDWREALFVLVPEGHRLATRHTISLKELAEERFIFLKSGYGLRRVTDKLCSRAGFKPRVTFEGEEVATLWGLVGAGLGLASDPVRASLPPGLRSRCEFRSLDVAAS